MASYTIEKVLVFATVLFSNFVNGDTCSGNIKGLQILPDSDDCAKFYICYGSRSFQFSCNTKVGPSKVFDPISRTCVASGSVYDHSIYNTNCMNDDINASYSVGELQKGHNCSFCNTVVTAFLNFTRDLVTGHRLIKHRNMEGRCQVGVVSDEADEDSCARYYHCDGGLEGKAMECPYPRLFDRSKGTCELYLFVNCDSRMETKDPCDYESNQCFGSGCVPCRARFGTCVGLPNGPNPFEGKLWTPHFVICRDQRVILHGDCRQNGKIKLFNPFTRKCSDVPSLLKQARTSKFRPSG